MIVAGIILALATASAIGLGTCLFVQRREQYSPEWDLGVCPTEKTLEAGQ